MNINLSKVTYSKGVNENGDHWRHSFWLYFPEVSQKLYAQLNNPIYKFVHFKNLLIPCPKKTRTCNGTYKIDWQITMKSSGLSYFRWLSPQNIVENYLQYFSTCSVLRIKRGGYGFQEENSKNGPKNRNADVPILDFKSTILWYHGLVTVLQRNANRNQQVQKCYCENESVYYLVFLQVVNV